MTRILPAALAALLLLAGCAGRKQAPAAVPEEPQAAADTLVAATREDSLRIARSLYLLVLDLENQGVSAGTTDLLARARAYDPEDRWLAFRALEALLRTGHADSALALAERIKDLPGDTTASQELVLGQTLRVGGKPEAALEALRKGAELDEENVRILFETVLVLESLKRYPDMAVTHRRIVELLDYPDELVTKQLLLYTMVRDLEAQEAFYRELWSLRGEEWGRRLLKWLLEEKLDERALAVAAELAAADPENEHYRAIKVYLLLQNGKRAEARAALDSAWRKDTTKIDLLRQMAILEAQLGEADSAIAHIGQVLARDSADGATLLAVRGELRRERGEDSAALEDVRAAIRLGGPNVDLDREELRILLKLERYDEAYSVIDRLEKNPQAKGDFALIRANVQVNHSFWLDFRHLDRRRADSLRVEALPAIRRAAEAGPPEFVAVPFSGSGDAPPPALREGDGKKPAFNVALFHLAEILDKLGKFDEAKVHYERLLALDPDNAVTLNSYGYTLLEHDEQIERADSMITRALEQDPGNGAIIDSKAWALHKLGRNEEALKLLESIEDRADMDLSEFHEHKATVLEALGRKKEALEHWKKVVGGLREAAKEAVDLTDSTAILRDESIPDGPAPETVPADADSSSSAKPAAPADSAAKPVPEAKRP